MYQVAIIGSGITGTILGTILQKSGFKTLILEEKSHPRFAIGESTVPQTPAMLRVLGLKYGILEITNLSTYNGTLAFSRTCGVKRNIGYVYHDEGQAASINRCLQSLLPDLPHGSDCHWFRQNEVYKAGFGSL